MRNFACFLLALVLGSTACDQQGMNEALPGGDGADGHQREVNVYSHRHYDTDRGLFASFTEQTGIQVKLVMADADELMARLQREGENSPCDLLITADAGRLHLARERGLFQPMTSGTIERNVPERYRDPEGYWTGLTVRARVLAYHKDRVAKDALKHYHDLLLPKWRGRILVRSSENIYNQSLMAAMVAHLGEEKALAWAMGVVANMARRPIGGDTDQLLAVAEGLGDVAIVNSYYVAKLMASDDPDKAKARGSLAIVFPDLEGHGTHVNVSGAGIAKHAPNRDAAILLLEYLTSREAQERLVEENQEYAVLAGIAPPTGLADQGVFTPDTLDLALLGKHNAQAVKLLDLAGWR